MTLAIVHREGERAVLDVIRECKPPFSPESVVADLCALLKTYRIGTVVGDKYAGLWPRERFQVQGFLEVFNLFNITNVLGVSNVNYSGFSNVLIRDSEDPNSPGFLKSSSFGRPVTTAGGVFGSGGPRAFQLAVRFTF
jgi:hypothetical protein